MNRLLVKTFAFISLSLMIVICHTNAQGMQDDDAKYATELLKAGTAAPDFQLTTPNGQTVSLSNYKGKYVVLDFWASWCPDCRKDAPNIVAAYNEFKEKNVAFIGISFDTDKVAWENAITKYEIKYPQVSELKKWKETTISDKYHIKWIPSMYLIDPEGKIVLGTIISEKLIKTLGEVIK
ncbi:MAG: peroxiredoxin family protein [Phocaeicola sp.]|uniref:peroxiredoxin family protein n=1 Tax=Phocaeicola sp. TaxID=2773926 RepID=UPI003F9FB733